MNVIGIDLSGPSNVADTAVTVFHPLDDGIRYDRAICPATDEQIRKAVGELAKQVPTVVGIDAPLSYNPGGGDRPADSKLRERIIEVGMRSGSVMPPTLTRMVYLTLRGVVLSRDLIALPNVRVVEVHPGATCALRGASIADVTAFARDADARNRLLRWMEGMGLRGIPGGSVSSHYVASCAAALAAWKWAEGEEVWKEPASPPDMPFDFAC